MSAQTTPVYALAYFVQQGLDGAFDEGPYEAFDPEWVQGNMFVFRHMPNGAWQLALREMVSHAAMMSLDLTMGLAKFFRSPGITRDQAVLCEMALARSPWVHDETSAQWVRRDGAQLPRLPLGRAFHAAFDNERGAYPSAAPAASVAAAPDEIAEERGEMVTVPRGQLLRLAQATVDLQCERKIQVVNPGLWSALQVAVVDLVREHVSPQEFARARASQLQGAPAAAPAAGAAPSPPSRPRPVERLVTSNTTSRNSAASSMQPTVVGRSRGERFSAAPSTPVLPSTSVPARPVGELRSRPIESGVPRRAERFRA